MSRPRFPATSLAISVVLHALVFAAVVTGVLAPVASGRSGAILVKPPETVTFEFVDTPEAPPAKADEPTNLISERDTRAADRGPRDLPVGAPFSEGRTSLPNPSAGQGATGEPAPAREPVPTRPDASVGARAPEEGAPARSEPAGADSEDRLGSRPADRLGSPARSSSLGDRRLEVPRRELAVAPPMPAPGGGRRGLPQVDNRLTRARYEGDFSLSTYAWDYAPYMRRLKRQIEDYTWTILPTAFWYGIAGWATQVRFVILPDGSLKSIVITGHEGVLDLRHVAPDAVNGAADFEPLPPGFPEPTLVVTGNFYFNVFPPSRGSPEDSSRVGPREDS